MMPKGADPVKWAQLVGVVGDATWLAKVVNNPDDEVQGDPKKHEALKARLSTMSKASTLPLALKGVLKL